MKAVKNHSGRIEVKKGADYVLSVQFAWRQVFEKACEHEGIDTNSKFVVFTDDNPFTPYVDKAAAEYFRVLGEYQAGGYVGLTMA